MKYIAKLSARTEWPPELANASISFYGYNIFVFYAGEHPTNTYWTDWGGTYDTPTTTDIQLFFEQFLVRVETEALLLATDFSFYSDGSFIFLNIPRKPWQYLQSNTELTISRGYQSAVRDANNPSDDTYNDAVNGSTRYPSRLLIPSVSNKLSDPVSGTTLYSTFKFTLVNDDGFFDDIQELNYENTPAEILKAIKSVPELSDYNVIRRGLVEFLSVDRTSMTVTVADYIRTFTDSVTRKFNTTDFPSAPNDTIDKDIPIGYGSLKKVPLFEVGTNQWVAIDPTYLTSVSAVYDSDGNSIAFSVSSGVITATDAATADVTGATNNRIGEIIVSEIEDKSNYAYLEGNYDKAESDIYVNGSAKVNFYYASGTVRELVTRVLKNDSAFLIAKNDGRLTLRQWGNTYDTHNFSSWQIMNVPKKSTQESKTYYTTSVLVRYDKQIDGNLFLNQYQDDTREQAIVQRYRKRKENVFETEIDALSDVQDFATLILSRFGGIKENLTLELSEDLSEVNILDTINIDVTINGRQFTRTTEWVVRDVDPGQDVVVLEGALFNG